MQLWYRDTINIQSFADNYRNAKCIRLGGNL